MPINPDEYTRQVYQAIPPERWRRIIEQLARQAEEGDLQAVRVLLPYFRRQHQPAGQLRLSFMEDEP